MLGEAQDAMDKDGQPWHGGVRQDTSTPTICQETPAWTCSAIRASVSFCKSHLKTCGGRHSHGPWHTPYAAALIPVQIIPPPTLCDLHIPDSLVLLIPHHPRRMTSCQSLPQIFLKLNSSLLSEGIFLNSSLGFSVLHHLSATWIHGQLVSAASCCFQQLCLSYMNSLD